MPVTTRRFVLTVAELRARRAQLEADKAAAAEQLAEARRSARLAEAKRKFDKQPIDVRQLTRRDYKKARVDSLRRLRQWGR